MCLLSRGAMSCETSRMMKQTTLTKNKGLQATLATQVQTSQMHTRAREQKTAPKRAAFQPPSGTRPIEFHLGKEQFEIVEYALGWIKKRANTKVRTVALDYCCLDYLAGAPEKNLLGKVIATPNDGSTQPFHVWPHEDQEQIIRDALEMAHIAIGSDDAGAALTHICATFIACLGTGSRC
jgi:hypothetical protein